MKLLLKLTVSVVLLGIIVWQLGGARDIASVMSNISPVYILLVFLVSTIDRALMTFKWARLLRGQRMHLPFIHGLKIYCASYIWGLFLPVTVGADVIRAVNTSRIGLDSKKVAASIIIERMVGFISALLLSLLSLVLLSKIVSLDDQFQAFSWLSFAILITTIIAFAASFSQNAFNFLYGYLLYRFKDAMIVERLKKFHSTYLSYRDGKRNLAIFFALTLSEQLMPIITVWLIARGLGIEVGLLFLAGTVPLAVLISRIPISIDGLGVFEATFILLMALVGVSPVGAAAISVVGRILQIAACLPWWIADVMNRGSFQPPTLSTQSARQII